jgi:hypothetical protein
MLKEILKELDAQKCYYCEGAGMHYYMSSGCHEPCHICDGFGKEYSGEQKLFLQSLFPYSVYKQVIEELKDKVRDLENSLSNE